MLCPQIKLSSQYLYSARVLPKNDRPKDDNTSAWSLLGEQSKSVWQTEPALLKHASAAKPGETIFLLTINVDNSMALKALSPVDLRDSPPQAFCEIMLFKFVDSSAPVVVNT